MGLIPDIVHLGTLRARERPGDRATRPTVASADGFEIRELKPRAGGQFVDVVGPGQVGSLLEQPVEFAGVVRESLEQLRDRAGETFGVDDEPEVDLGGVGDVREAAQRRVGEGVRTQRYSRLTDLEQALAEQALPPPVPPRSRSRWWRR